MGDRQQRYAGPNGPRIRRANAHTCSKGTRANAHKYCSEWNGIPKRNASKAHGQTPTYVPNGTMFQKNKGKRPLILFRMEQYSRRECEQSSEAKSITYSKVYSGYITMILTDLTDKDQTFCKENTNKFSLLVFSLQFLTSVHCSTLY